MFSELYGNNASRNQGQSGKGNVEGRKVDMRAERLCFEDTIEDGTAKDLPFYYPPGILGDEMRELERRFLSREDVEELVAKHLSHQQLVTTTSRNSIEYSKPPTAKKQRTKGYKYTPALVAAKRISALNRAQPKEASTTSSSRKDVNAGERKRAASTSVFNNGKGYTISVAEPTDKEFLTLYQTVIRSSLEYFTSVDEDVKTTVQGRRQTIVNNQLGIRCSYCSHLPIKARSKAAVYYPKSIMSLYQGAQNIASVHFPICSNFPPQVLKALEVERTRRNVDKAGRPYWAEKCRGIGIYEAEESLWLCCETKG